MEPPIFISGDQVRKLLKPQELLDALEISFGNFSMGVEGGVVQPVRSVLSVEKHHGFLGVMPAYSRSDEALATKLVAFYPENKDLPTHLGQVLLFEPTNGLLKAILDGESITAIRTGVASAVATKHLARPDSKILAILGSGIQARSHYQALSLLQTFDEVRVWSRTQKAQKFAKEIGAKCCSSVEETVKDADIICTVTFAQTPILNLDMVKPGAHINAVGACRFDWQEIDASLMKDAVVYVDSREACLKEAGDIIQSGAEIYAEIGEVINGIKEAYWKKTTIFKSVGMAIEDAISAKMVFDKYKKAAENNQL